MPKRKVHKKDIIAAAYGLFTAHGFSKTSMSHIASACGLLKGSIYHYFDSKEDLIEAVLQSSLAYKSLGLIPIAYNSELAPRARLERFLHSIETQNTPEAGGNLILAAVLEIGSEPRYRVYLERLFDEWIKAVDTILESGSNANLSGITAQEILEHVQGAIITSLARQDQQGLKRCHQSIIKRSFD